MTIIEFIASPAVLLFLVALVLGIAILIISKKFAVQSNQAVDEILDILPGANCGACGLPGCQAYAEALVNEDIENTSLCSVGGADTAKELAEYLGKVVDDFNVEVASVMCMGTNYLTTSRYEYKGLKSCTAANSFQSGPKSCQYGCIGFGDCVDVCEYDAIHVIDGVAKVDADNCTACKKCVAVCPKQLIHMVPKRDDIHEVRCANLLSGVLTKKMCDIGCIGCGKCVKVCEDDAISLKLSVAFIDQAKCIQCSKCLEVCPTHSITMGLDYYPQVVEKKTKKVNEVK
ncbi:MAG: RnfABCDGE type electron transport complex subunit B [Coriobacteriia bacterium]|nr:RnfABCDGE type electron transport complex subunit B [Coriobacteriia bacterium]